MKTRTLVTAALLVALGVALNYVPFISRVPLLPSAPFLEYSPSDIPTLLGTFALGPIVGTLIGLMRALAHAAVGNTGGLVGTTMDAFSSMTLALSAGLIYQYMKTRKGAVIALVTSALAMTAAAVALNYFWAYPAFGAPAELVWTTALPFNLIKGTINGVVVFLLYKPLSVVLHGQRD